MSMSIISHRDKKENNQSSQSSLKGIKYKSNRILKPIGSANSVIFNDRQITEQLMQQLTRITEIINKYKEVQKNYDLSFKDGGAVKQIINLQEIILRKDNEIKQINEQIKDLKSANYNTESSSLRKEPQNELFKLADQLRLQRSQLQTTIQEHSQQVKKYHNFKGIIKKLETKYNERYGNRMISYEEFKERYEQNKKQYENKKKRGYKQIKNGNNKQKVESTLEVMINPKGENSIKTMKQLQNKKLITQTALKNARKKHTAQISQLNAKLQFLRDEDALLNEKIKQVEGQKQQMQQKFKLNLLRNNKYPLKGVRGCPSYLNNFVN